jgi:4-hydroxybenzoate polyprenyltransferase
VTPRALLRLCRIPNVFTAFADPVAGVLVARGAWRLDHAALVGASGCLYLAGMVLNDFFDREVDRRERPERPIPSGEITPATALWLGMGLLAAGLGLAARAGSAPLAVALALAACIVLYDAGGKASRFGPLLMGGCRALNVTLGIAAVGAPRAWPWALPLALGLFTALVTVLSRSEVQGGGLRAARRVVSGFAALFCAIVAATLGRAATLDAVLVTAAPLGFVAWRGAGLLLPLLRDARPPTLGRAIGGSILLMPAVDACFVAAAGAPAGAALVFALAGPAYLLKRWYYVT